MKYVKAALSKKYHEKYIVLEHFMNEGMKSHDYLYANKAVDEQNPVPKMNLEMLSAMCNIESHVTSVS